MTDSSPVSLLKKIKAILVASVVGRYLGLGLAKRDPKFNLVARFTTRKITMETNGQKLLEQWEALQDKPAAWLETLQNHLELLLKNGRLSSAEFQGHVLFALEYIYPRVEEIYYRYRRTGGIPDAPLKTMLVEGGMQLIHLLLRGVAVQFQHDYRLPNHLFAKVIPRLGACLGHVLDLVWLLQHLHIMRHKKIPREYAIMAAKAYQAYLPFGEVASSRKLLSKANLMMTLEVETGQGASRAEASLRDMFGRVLLIGLFDSQTLPPGHMATLVAYLGTHGSFDWFSEQGDAGQEAWTWSLPQGDFIPPGRSAEPPCLSFALQPLLDRLTEDVVLASDALRGDSEDPRLGQPPYGLLGGRELWALLSLMLEQVRQTQWVPPLSDRTEAPGNLHVILGFLHCYNFLNDLLTLSPIKFQEKNAMLLSLSQGSAILVGDENDVSHSGGKRTITKKDKVDRNVWLINADMSRDRVLYLNTVESDQSRPMRLGQTVLFLTREESAWQPGELGFIHRLVRGAEGKIYLGIFRLASKSQPVILRRQAGGDAALPCLVIQDLAGGDVALFPFNPLFHQDVAVMAQHPDGQRRLGVLAEPVFPGEEAVACRVVWS